MPVYATCGFSFLDDEQLAEVATKVAGQGFKGLKMQVGRPGLDTRKNPPPVAEIVASDVRRIRGVREAVGAEVEIAIDAGCRLDLPGAASLCRLVEDQNIAFFEEPIVQNDVRLLAELRQKTSIPLTAGQNEGLAYRFRDMLLAGAVDVVQPNVIITGGITQCLRIAGMAASFNVPISNGGGAPFHNRHLQAGVQNGTAVELQFNAVLACSAIYKDPPGHKDGWMSMPEAPGLGLTVDRAAVDRLVDAG